MLAALDQVRRLAESFEVLARGNYNLVMMAFEVRFPGGEGLRRRRTLKKLPTLGKSVASYVLHHAYAIDFADLAQIIGNDERHVRRMVRDVDAVREEDVALDDFLNELCRRVGFGP